MTQIVAERKVVIPVPEVFCKMNERYDALSVDIISKQDELERLRIMFANIHLIRKAYNGLKEVWKQKDPGKYGVAYFLTDAFGDGIITREIVPQEHWENESTHGRMHDIPPWCEECPCCHEQLPVIMTYDQTEDSPSGDEWTKTWNVYCPKCSRITEVREPQVRGHRF